MTSKHVQNIKTLKVRSWLQDSIYNLPRQPHMLWIGLNKLYDSRPEYVNKLNILSSELLTMSDVKAGEIDAGHHVLSGSRQ